jgi:prepilin-type N-terminal cleavage/methylation domain-containing protein
MERGFTLVEVLLSMVLYSILTLTIGILLWVTVKSAEKMSSHEETLSQARFAMEIIGYEMITLKTSDITSIAASEIDFKDSSAIATSYRLANVGGVNQVLRGSSLLIPKASAFSFTYLDNNGNVTATIANIRQIKWTLTLPETSGGSVSLQSAVFLRSSYYATFK